jgi:parallel beta-helix repeat protein
LDRNVYIFFAAILCLFAAFHSTSANILYVAKNHIQANDANPGNENLPWLTIQNAADKAVAGDTIYIKNGLYNELVIVKKSGLPENFITFKEYPGHEVIIDGTGLENVFGLFNIYGKDFIRLEGVEIRNNSTGFGVLIQHGDSLEYASHIELKGLNLHHMGGEVIEMRGNVSHVLINDCIAHHGIPYEEMVWIGINVQGWRGGRPHHITITGCTTYNFDPEGKYGGVRGGIANERGDHITVTHNLVYDAGMGIDIGSGDSNIVAYNKVHDCETGIALSSNEDSKVFNNIIYNIKDEALYSYYWIKNGEGHARNKFFNNVIYNAGFGVYETNNKNKRYGSGPTYEHQYFNNLFYNIGSHGDYRASFYFKGTDRLKFFNNTIYMNKEHDAIQLLDDANHADIRNNILCVAGDVYIFKHDSLSLSGTVIDYNCYHNRSGVSHGLGNHSINTDPKFVSVADSNFHLQSGSPCLNVGADLSQFFTTDLDSVMRPQSAGWDMGVFELKQ